MFKITRLKLTAWYLLIIAVISIAFSTALYRVLTAELNRFVAVQQIRFERRYPFPPPTLPPLIDQDLVRETKNRITLMLVLINGVVITVSGGLSFLLAGKTLQPIKQMFDDQNRFISDSSHELRTPLTSLRSSFEVALRDKKLSRADAISTISEGLDDIGRLQSLTDHLMQLSRFQQVDSAVQMKTIRLSQVVKKSLHYVSPLAKRKGIAISDKSTDAKLKGSVDQLSDALTILLDNAIKYSAHKSSITISTKRTDGRLLITVTDSGIGIDQKDLPHIFDRFFRADSARTRSDASGFGLGLSIAQRLIHLHHGTISVQSKPGQGSIFTINLPIFS